MSGAQYAELGLLGLPFDEEHGGFGGGPVETMIVMEAFGRALALEPFFATVVLGGGFLRLGGSEAQKKELLPKIADGEPAARVRADRTAGALRSRRRRDHGQARRQRLRARRRARAWCCTATQPTSSSSARASPASARDRNGIGLFLVDAKANGVSRRGYPTEDGLRAAEISFSNVRVGADAVIGEAGDGLPLIERVVDEASRRSRPRRSAPWRRCTS